MGISRPDEHIARQIPNLRPKSQIEKAQTETVQTEKSKTEKGRTLRPGLSPHRKMYLFYGT